MNQTERHRECSQLDPVAQAAATAPPDDEPITQEDAQRILEGKKRLANGDQGIPMEDLLAEFGLTIEDFPLKR